MKNNFKTGDIVTLKTHPLFNDYGIKGNGKFVPPFMVISEVFVENKNKKIYSEEEVGAKISERIKYTCVFFDDNKLEFKEVILYESMLETFEYTTIARIEGKKRCENYETLKEEIKKYKKPKYKYGKVVSFKTKKLEMFKKRISKNTTIKNIESTESKRKIKTIETVQYVVNFSTPDFIICGIKLNEKKNEYYPNGKLKREIGKKLYKIKWFNSNQMKFSEVYLPAECFFEEKKKNESDNEVME